MRFNKPVFSLLSFTFLSFFAACSSDVVIREPAPEPKVVTHKKVKLDTLWTRSYDADEDIPSGSFRPAIVDNTVFIATNEGNVASIDAETGRQHWKIDLETELSAGIVATSKAAIVAARNGDIIAVNGSGQEIWRTSLSREVIEVPFIDEDMVFVQTSNSSVFALDLSSGAQRWQFESRSPTLTLRGTNHPLVYKDRVLVALDSGSLVALKRATGALLWERKLQVPKGTNEFERIVDLDGRMTLHENVLFVPGYQGYLSAVEAYTGQILWQKEISSYMQPAYSVGRLYVADSDSHLITLDYRTGEAKWQSDSFQYRSLTGPKALGLYVLSSDMAGNVYVIDKLSAEVVAKKSLGKAPVRLVSTAQYAVGQTANGKVRALAVKE